MSDLVDLDRFAAAQAAFGEVVERVDAHQWTQPTPCTHWDVRALVNHVAVEQLWATPLLEGMSIADVGNRFDGDQLGEDPKGAWHWAVAESRAAFEAPGALDAVIQSSGGEEPARQYLSEMTFDLFVHRWDLGKAIGAQPAFDSQELQWLSGVITVFQDMSAQLVASGMFAAPVPVSDDADLQVKLLAAVGRT